MRCEMIMARLSLEDVRKNRMKNFFIKEQKKIEISPKKNNRSPVLNIKGVGGIGDVFWIEPVLRHLTGQEKEVHFYTPYPELLQNFPSPYLTVNEPINVDQGMRQLLALVDRPMITLGYLYDMPKMHVLDIFKYKSNVPEMGLSYPRL